MPTNLRDLARVDPVTACHGEGQRHLNFELVGVFVAHATDLPVPAPLLRWLAARVIVFEKSDSALGKSSIPDASLYRR